MHNKTKDKHRWKLAKARLDLHEEFQNELERKKERESRVRAMGRRFNAELEEAVRESAPNK